MSSTAVSLRTASNWRLPAAPMSAKITPCGSGTWRSRRSCVPWAGTGLRGRAASATIPKVDRRPSQPATRRSRRLPPRTRPALPCFAWSFRRQRHFPRQAGMPLRRPQQLRPLRTVLPGRLEDRFLRRRPQRARVAGRERGGAPRARAAGGVGAERRAGAPAAGGEGRGRGPRLHADGDAGGAWAAGAHGHTARTRTAACTLARETSTRAVPRSAAASGSL